MWMELPGCGHDGLVEVPKQGIQGHRVFAGAVGDGVEGGDIAADTLQSVAVKDGNGLGVSLDDILYQAVGGDLFGCTRIFHTRILSPEQVRRPSGLNLSNLRKSQIARAGSQPSRGLGPPRARNRDLLNLARMIASDGEAGYDFGHTRHSAICACWIGQQCGGSGHTWPGSVFDRRHGGGVQCPVP
jgi:hypothetical protein